MKHLVDGQLLRQAERFSLRFACDDCAHFDRRVERCSLGYPAEPRHGAIVVGGSLSFCKEFDLD